ncbi:hypothetical protein ENSA5_68000 [Enhygromyxa salina]|uniref:Uncharacterized protein n=1 Tax=Enhygromyxa salina TaxID=215803 RepID=A0A2S9XB32_9BACT|nr:hypothetical protein ENSA5_68000 [Enhygromyxa salina]
MTFNANQFRFLYIKVAGKELTLEPEKTIELREGSHTIKVRTNKADEWEKVGRCRLSPGHDYKILMLKSGGFKTIEVP